MAQITVEMVKELRAETGAGPLDCKKALENFDGDLQKAIEFLREKGMVKAAKKLDAGRKMNEGVVEIYLHHDHRLGVMVEVNCETDFVADTEQFRSFARDLTLHVASADPQYVKREDIPEDVVQAERDEQQQRAKDEGKPEKIVEKIVEGRMGKFYEKIVLMEQPFVKDDEKTIAQLLAETVAATGESIEISRFARFKIETPVEEDEF